MASYHRVVNVETPKQGGSDAAARRSITELSKPVGVEAAFQRLIPTGERSGLLTRTATTGGALLCMPTRSSARLLNLNVKC